MNENLKKIARKILYLSPIKQSKILTDKKDKPYKKRFLLFANYRENGINTIKDTIFDLIENSYYPIDLINIFPSVVLEKNFDFYKYDGIIIHNSVNYNVESIIRMDNICNQKIRDYKGLKIMFKQDEHHRHFALLNYLDNHNFDIIFTICDESNQDIFYPKERFPNLRKINYLTGYVNEKLKNLHFRDINNRTIDVGYRGSPYTVESGILSYEKQQIGTDFIKHIKDKSINIDISSKENDRIKGDAWYSFLGNCKGVLGVESGASIVDIDGNVEQDFKRIKQRNWHIKDNEILNMLSKYEDGPQYRAISPRHFEAAACFAVQIMYEGRFQDIFIANRHYIPLKRDYSNLDTVFEQLLDDKVRKNITECAYEEIICNPDYNYSTFIKKFDNAISDLL